MRHSPIPQCIVCAVDTHFQPRNKGATGVRAWGHWGHVNHGEVCLSFAPLTQRLFIDTLTNTGTKHGHGHGLSLTHPCKQKCADDSGFADASITPTRTGTWRRHKLLHNKQRHHRPKRQPCRRSTVMAWSKAHELETRRPRES
jgi:hypothetical protein